MALNTCLTAVEQTMALQWTRLALRSQRPGAVVTTLGVGIRRHNLSQALPATRRDVSQALPAAKLLKQNKFTKQLCEALAVSQAQQNASQNKSVVTTELPQQQISSTDSADSSAPPKRKSVKDVKSTVDFSPFSGKGFASLNLSEAVIRRLYEEGFKTPTEVQASAIPVLLEGHDAALQSYTGSGKTLAYLLPILSKLGPLKDGPAESGDGKSGIEAVIVAPSRELAMQIVREAEKILGDQNRKLVQQLIGGANQKRQEEGLKKNKPFMVVGTPGRISEISRAGKLHTHNCRYLVLDEADQILSTKYRDDMKRILEHVGLRRNSQTDDDRKPAEATRKGNRVERQTILVSATMPPAVLKAVQEWGHKPILIKPSSTADVESQPKESPTTSNSSSEAAEENSLDVRGARESLPPNLAHYYVLSSARHRVDTLRKCIHALDAKTVLVFMNFTQRLKDTVFKLEARGIDAGCLHGEMGKMERASILSAFKAQKLRVLVVSEVGARGLDVLECDLVVNLELPTDGTHYAHRGGRTGRIGREGTVVSICEEQEEFVLKKFEKQLGISIARCDISHGTFALYNNQTN